MVGASVPILATLLVNINPANNVHILWFTYPKGINALFALVSFGVSGIYLSFFLTVLGSLIAKRRGWRPAGDFRMGKWGPLVTWGALIYLGVMLVNVLWPSGLTSGRALVNYDWITFVVMLVIVIVGGLYFVISRPDKRANVKA